MAPGLHRISSGIHLLPDPPRRGPDRRRRHLRGHHGKRDTLDALSDSEERFRSILENAPIAIVLQDLDARIQLVNSAYEDFFIASADQLVGSVTPGLFGATLEARLDDAN